MIFPVWNEEVSQNDDRVILLLLNHRSLSLLGSLKASTKSQINKNESKYFLCVKQRIEP